MSLTHANSGLSGSLTVNQGMLILDNDWRGRVSQRRAQRRQACGPLHRIRVLTFDEGSIRNRQQRRRSLGSWIQKQTDTPISRALYHRPRSRPPRLPLSLSPNYNIWTIDGTGNTYTGGARPSAASQHLDRDSRFVPGRRRRNRQRHPRQLPVGDSSACVYLQGQQQHREQRQAVPPNRIPRRSASKSAAPSVGSIGGRRGTSNWGVPRRRQPHNPPQRSEQQGHRVLRSDSGLYLRSQRRFQRLDQRRNRQVHVVGFLPPTPARRLWTTARWSTTT